MGEDRVSKKNDDLCRTKGDTSENLTSRIPISSGTSPSHSTSVHQVHSNDDIAFVSNTLKFAVHKNTSQSFLMKANVFFPVSSGWRTSTSSAQQLTVG